MRSLMSAIAVALDTLMIVAIAVGGLMMYYGHAGRWPWE
jgi:hypothetical protein